MKSGWVIKKLGEVCELIGGGTPSIHVSSYYGGDIPWATVRDMNCRIISATERTITLQGFENSASNIIPAGNLVISTHVGLGKVCFVKNDTAINQDLKGVLPLGEDLDRTFLYYWFLSIADFIIANGTGSTVKGVKLEFVKKLNIPIPPLAEQKRIVAKIDAAFEKIDKLKANAEKNLANAKELFQSALDEAMCPKEHWVEKRLPDISTNYDSKRIPITKKQRRVGNVPYYGASGIVDYVEGYIFDGEYLLISEDGANLESRTYPIAFSISGKTWVNNHAHILKFEDLITQSYVELYLNSISLKDYITGAAQPKLTQVNLNKIPIPLPSLAEQREIVKRLDLLSEKIKLLEQNYTQLIADCAEIRQSVLREAFEGRI